MSLEFRVVATAGNARAGICQTAHGAFETPAFMPVGTVGTVKALTPEDLRVVGTQVILCNAYHLYLRPGVQVVQELGGLHHFMAWPGPILTDSGGYQALSLGPLAKVDDDGVTFRSHLDGTTHRFTPEHVMEIQAALGVDISMVLDHCPAGDCAAEEQLLALGRTQRWAERSIAARASGQSVFGIVQGGTDLELRRTAVDGISALPFDGYALGGFAVGEAVELTMPIVAACAPWLPADRPRYLMGMGTPADIVAAVRAGIDMFDCVLPTRAARHGVLYTSEGRLNLGNAQYKSDPGPADPKCECPTCKTFSRAYLRHLYKSGELLWHRVASVHNLAFYLGLVKSIRDKIIAGQDV